MFHSSRSHVLSYTRPRLVQIDCSLSPHLDVSYSLCEVNEFIHLLQIKHQLVSIHFTLSSSQFQRVWQARQNLLKLHFLRHLRNWFHFHWRCSFFLLRVTTFKTRSRAWTSLFARLLASSLDTYILRHTRFHGRAIVVRIGHPTDSLNEL